MGFAVATEGPPVCFTHRVRITFEKTALCRSGIFIASAFASCGLKVYTRTTPGFYP